MIKGLYDSFAQRWYHGGSIWFYSDPHFSDEEMKNLRKNYIGDEEQVKRINSKIGKNDTIIFLGDIGNTDFIKKIRGYKVLIMGNHDAGASNYQRKLEMPKGEAGDLVPQAFYIDNHLFDEVYEGALIIGPKIILSHEPIDFPFAFNIHGHDHSNWYSGKNHLNVCAEHIDYTPISLTQLLKNGYFKDIDDIHRVTIDNATERKAKRQNKKL